MRLVAHSLHPASVLHQPTSCPCKCMPCSSTYCPAPDTSFLLPFCRWGQETEGKSAHVACGGAGSSSDAAQVCEGSRGGCERAGAGVAAAAGHHRGLPRQKQRRRTHRPLPTLRPQNCRLPQVPPIRSLTSLLTILEVIQRGAQGDNLCRSLTATKFWTVHQVLHFIGSYASEDREAYRTSSISKKGASVCFVLGRPADQAPSACAGKAAAVLLPRLTETLPGWFEATRHSSFLYVASELIKVFGSDTAHVQELGAFPGLLALYLSCTSSSADQELSRACYMRHPFETPLPCPKLEARLLLEQVVLCLKREDARR